MAVCGDQCVPKTKSIKPTWEKNLKVSKIREKIIPTVVKTAIVEKIKNINFKILSTLLLASYRTDRFLYDTKLNMIESKTKDEKEITLVSWYFSTNRFASLSDIKPLLMRVFKLEILFIKKLLTYKISSIPRSIVSSERKGVTR